jgi:microcompartment protein CcmL/EutN
VPPELRVRIEPLPDSVALIEVGSIAQGYAVADALVKAAAVRLLLVEPVTPGKLIILYSGSVAEIDAAHARGVALAGDDLIDQLVLPGVHADVLMILERPGGEVEDALGIIETTTVAAGILAADSAAKASNAGLLEIHAAKGIGGKTTVLLSGTTADATTSVDAGAGIAETRRALVRKVVIARAHEDLGSFLGDRWSRKPVASP